MNITVSFDSIEEMKAFALAMTQEGAAEALITTTATAPAAPVAPDPVPQPVTPQTPQAPVQTAPAPTPTTQQAPAPTPTTQQAPAPTPTTQQAPIQTAPAPIPPNPAQAMPPVQPAAPQGVPTQTPQYTLENLAQAAVQLQDAGRTPDLITLLQKYGVQSMTQLDPSVFGAFATDLRGLGAQI